MSFPKYPKYKDSGVEWLGDVPEHWDVRRLKSLVAEPLKYGANESAELDDRTLPRFVRITDISDDGGLRDETFKSLPTDVAAPYLLKEGDVLLARSGATVGKSFIYSREWGTACFAGYLIRVRLRDCHCMPTWLYYFCQTDGYWGYVVGSQIQATIQNVSAEKYANLYLPLSTRSEQAAIVSFLDRETSKIDSLVAEQRRLIELLKEKRQAVISHAVTKGLNPHAPMKPSGIEWLGDVPEHWEVTSIRRISKRVETGGTPSAQSPGEDESDGFLWYTPGDFNDGSIRLGDSKRRVAKGLVETGDVKTFPPSSVLIVSIGATLGKVGFSSELCSSNQQINAVIPNDRVQGNFLAYSLSVKSEVMRYLSNASTIGIMNQEKTKVISLAVPPSNEQVEIVEYLDAETARVDILEAEAERAIELLQERRTALISAAVTGKIDVRNLVESN